KKKQENPTIDMAKIQIKSERLTSFGGLFSIMEQFDSTLSSVIDSTLGLRCRSFHFIARFLAIAENTVFLLLTALIRNFYKTIIQRLGVKKLGLNATSRIKAFVFRFISVPAKWIRTSRRYVLNIYTCNNAYADVFQTDFADSINASDVEEWARTINEDDNNTTEEKGAKKKASK
ncbi:hypothetical protein HMPREF0647_02145, partial [Prevotella bivia DNF00320]